MDFKNFGQKLPDRIPPCWLKKKGETKPHDPDEGMGNYKRKDDEKRYD